MTTYAIVRWNPGFDRAKFDLCKGQGVAETSFDTVRKSLDGKLAVLKWTGTAAQIPAAIGANLVATYDHAGILAEMVKPEWAVAHPAVRTTTFRARHGKKIAAGLVAAAAIGGAIAWWLLL